MKAERQPMVRARGLVLAHGDRVALAASDLEIPSGAVTALIGPNGAGKSTLLDALAGLLRPREGSLELDLHGRAPEVAYVLQATKVNETMPVTVRETVAMGRYALLGPFRRFRSADREAVERALDRLDIAELADRHLGELSGGQRQRVFVAQGLVQEAELLLLDEPVTGLDLVSRDAILHAADEEAARGATVVISTHDLDEARRSDHVVLLAGRVVAEGPPDRIVTPEALSEAYGVRLVPLPSGELVLDDPHHDAVGGRHTHYDRTGHAHDEEG